MYPSLSAENQRYFDEQFELLNNVVKLGCNIAKANINPRTTGPENIAPVILFRHFLDIIDSISHLVKIGNSDTPKMLLRPAFEILLYLEYIFKSNTTEKCLSYMVKEYLNEIKNIERLNPKTNRGKTLYKHLQDNGFSGTLPFDNAEYERNIKLREDLLENEPYKPIYDQYLANKKGFKWYQLFGGANNVEQLSHELGYALHYEIFYRKWSGGIHGSDLYLGRMFEDKETGRTDVTGLRYPMEIPIIVEHALKLSHSVFSAFLLNRIPESIEKFQQDLNALKFAWSKYNEANERQAYSTIQ